MALDWSPFGGNPVPGDPGQVRALAQRFSDFVGQVNQQHGLLMDVHNGVGGVWMSPAGRAFSPHLGQLPGQLQKLHTSYADAADALDAYWPELQDAQSMATTALAKVHAAIQAQGAAKAAQAQDYQVFQVHQAELEQQAKQQANQSGLPVTFTLSSYSPSPAVVAQTDQANQAYQAAISLKDQAVEKAKTAAQRLSGRLDDASKAGIQNPHYGFFGGLLHDAESAFDGATHWVGQHAGTIETVAAAALGPAGLLLTSQGRALLKHAMEAMNPVFEAVSGVCGVVSFGLAIVGFIPGVGEVADALNEGVNLVRTGADAGMLVDGELEGNKAEVSDAEQNLEGDALGLMTGGESRLATGLDDLAGDSGTVARVVDDAGASRVVDDGDGPVEIYLPKKGATPEEIDQMQAYVDAANRAKAEGALSPTGRVSTEGELRLDSNVAAREERARAEAAGTPYQGHVGHAPDATWTGKPQGYEWHDQTGRVNTSLGRQAQRYPIGYRPTRFVLRLPDEQPVSPDE
jgi:hypothetical protein